MYQKRTEELPEKNQKFTKKFRGKKHFVMGNYQEIPRKVALCYGKLARKYLENYKKVLDMLK